MKTTVHTLRKLKGQRPIVAVTAYDAIIARFASEAGVDIVLVGDSVGNVLLGSTHGDKVKGPDLLPVMATDVARDWGDTTHRYWYVGHVHHQDIKEYRGGVVEYFRTLAARDAWHAGQGYRAGRDMRLIVHHKQAFRHFEHILDQKASNVRTFSTFPHSPVLGAIT